jgi:hypothetical protein|uniref:Uncharacterized protein n=1 Tax=Zea mays TaxID=4577 RepID=A0A804LM76_MAIZE
MVHGSAPRHHPRPSLRSRPRLHPRPRPTPPPPPPMLVLPRDSRHAPYLRRAYASSPRPPETRQVSLPCTARSTIGAPFPGEPQPSTFLATGDLPSLALGGEPTPPPHGCPPDPSPVHASAPPSATHLFSPTSPMAWTATSLTL